MQRSTCVYTPGYTVYVNIFSRDTSGLPTHRSPTLWPGGLNFGQTTTKFVQKRKKWQIFWQRWNEEGFEILDQKVFLLSRFKFRNKSYPTYKKIFIGYVSHQKCSCMRRFIRRWRRKKKVQRALFLNNEGYCLLLTFWPSLLFGNSNLKSWKWTIRYTYYLCAFHNYHGRT